MKRKGIVAFLIILALGTGLTLLNRCSGGDMATVTIKLVTTQLFRRKVQINLITFQYLRDCLNDINALLAGG